MPTGKEYADLVDFFEQWPSKRGVIQAVAEDDEIDDEARRLLRTMIFVDRKTHV